MNIRWYTAVTIRAKWSDREDKYIVTKHREDPVLQFKDQNGNWKNVPTTEQIK